MRLRHPWVAAGHGCGAHERIAHHSCAQNADHLAQNTTISPIFTEVVCSLGATPKIGGESKETTMDASAIRAIARHAHTTTSATSTERRRFARRAQLGKLIRIAPGYYLDTEAITAHPDPGTVVALARLAAIQHKHPHLIASGPTAAWLFGLPLLGAHPLHVTTATNQHPRPIELPKIQAGSLHFPAMAVQPHRPRGGRSPAMIRHDGDFLGITLEDTVVDCALCLAEEEAFVVACAGLHELARYRRFYRDDSRQREEHSRERLLRLIGASSQGRRHAISARWIVTHADAGCESAGESRLLYLLVRGGLQGLETQYPVSAANKWYFIDIAIPEHRIGIEFDGRGKYGSDVDSVHRSIEAEERRQRLLEAQGWRIRRFRWEALAHPEEVIAQIQALHGRD